MHWAPFKICHIKVQCVSLGSKKLLQKIDNMLVSNLRPWAMGSVNAPPGCEPWLPVCSGCKSPLYSWGGSNRRRLVSRGDGLLCHQYHRRQPFRPLGQKQDKFPRQSRGNTGNWCRPAQSPSRTSWLQRKPDQSRRVFQFADQQEAYTEPSWDGLPRFLH